MPTSPVRSLHPRDFDVNQAWLAFRMNRIPFITPEGEFDVFVLQDAASLFIFGSVFCAAGAQCPEGEDVADLFDRAWSSLHAWPATLLLPGKPSSGNTFVATARAHGIDVEAVAEARMSFYIKDVQSSFEAHAGRSREAGEDT